MAYDGYHALRVDVEDGIATVFLDHPPINLFDADLVGEIGRIGAELRDDDEVRVVVVRSAIEGFFIAHADARMILSVAAAGETPVETRTRFVDMCDAFRTMPKATIAVIEGRCCGGGSELALSCDMRFAARETAIFNQWEVAIGLLAGGGGVSRLARLMGRSRALEAMLGCDDFTADVAELYGWVNRALPAAELDPYVDRLARRIASFPTYAVAACKAAVLERIDPDGRADLVRDSQATRPLLQEPQTIEALERFLAAGGQTLEGEAHFADLL